MPSRFCIHYVSKSGKPSNGQRTGKHQSSYPIPKKGSTKECANHQTVTLISHASKVMLKILHARLQHYMNQELPDVQAGFKKGRGTRNQIANVLWIIEKQGNFKNIYLFHRLCYKTFDCVYPDKLWKAIQFSSVQSLSHVRLFATHESQHARPLCPSPTPRVHSDSCPSSQWCHPAISFSVVPFSSFP